jgi:radical SAM superfamily enzyme YgiQ (UPF0313 family)
VSAIKKILLVYPESPNTFWSFTHALKFISKKSSFPPLGLITIAAMLPDTYERKLIDMNVTALNDKDIQWADYVFISAMVIQKKSARAVIERCKSLGVKTVAGGPLFTFEHAEFDDVDHLLLYEGELTVPNFLHDLENGCPKHLYTINNWTDISQTPIPAWDLVEINKYATLNIQYSRGCPFNCEFCNITTLFGRVPRTKSAEQLLSELDIIYEKGWRGGVFFVDDNFIGNRTKLKNDILPTLIQWMEKRDYPFSFLTEVSINLSDDDELMRLMVKAGFETVFVGIETVNEASLAECNKIQNRNRDMSECVRKIQKNGLQVQGGFIVGFDSDNETIFEKMIRFIQDTGIVTAMVGLLNAPKGTLLYKRLEREGRITESFSGNNMDLSINFVPKMNFDTLINGYKDIVSTIYSPEYYYERVMNFLKEFRPIKLRKPHFSLNEIRAFIKANINLGFFGKERKYYWKLFLWSMFKRPRLFPLAITLAIYGYHFRKTIEENV